MDWPAATLNVVAPPAPIENSLALALSATVAGEPGASLAIDSVATLAPGEPGAKLTVTVQVAPAASVAGSVPQVLVELNWFESAPLMDSPPSVTAPPPVLLSVIGVAAVLAPTSVVPIARLVVDTASEPAPPPPPPPPAPLPVPLRAIATGLPAACR